MLLSLLDRHDEAIKLLKRETLRAPNFLSNYIALTIAYSRAGDQAGARAAVKEILRISPAYEAEEFERRFPFRDQSISEGFTRALREAGVQ